MKLNARIKILFEMHSTHCWKCELQPGEMEISVGFSGCGEFPLEGAQNPCSGLIDLVIRREKNETKQRFSFLSHFNKEIKKATICMPIYTPKFNSAGDTHDKAISDRTTSHSASERSERRPSMCGAAL